MPKVTVIIPAYNAEPHIEQCANSVLNQTLDDIEILFIDDGSTDRTGEILDRIANENENVRIIHQENCGIFRTRAKAIREAKGAYLGWVDADDIVEPSMFETLYHMAISSNSELAYCDYQYQPESVGTKEKWFRKYEGKRDIHFVERNSQFWNKLVKRELLIRERIPEMLPDCFEESMIKVLLKAENPVWTEKQLYYYTVVPGSMSSRYKNVDYYKGFIEASKNLAKEMANSFPEKYWTDYFDFRVVYYYLMAMIVAANAKNRDEYETLKYELQSIYPAYSENQHYKPVMADIYGKLKAVVIESIVPHNYLLTTALCKLQFRGGTG